MDFMIARVRAKLPANIYIFGCRFLRRRRVGALLRNITFLRVRDMWIEEEGLSTCQKRTFQHLGESVRLFFSFIWRHRSEHQPTDLRCKRKAFFFWPCCVTAAVQQDDASREKKFQDMETG